MTAVIPPKPATGGQITAAWGLDVHDRTFNPKGIVATGVATPVAQQVNVLLDLSNTNSGNAQWHNGSTGLMCPVDHNGWYHCELFVQVTSGPAAGTPFRARILRNGGLIIANTALILAATTTSYLTVCGTFQLNDGDILTVDAWCAVAMTLTVPRFSVLRSMNAVATS